MADLIAKNDAATTDAGVAVNVPVLANDTIDGVPVQLSDLVGPPTISSPPSEGEVTVEEDGSITYTPPPGFCGTVTFEYKIESPEDVQVACFYFGEAWDLLTSFADIFDTSQPLVATIEGEEETCSVLHFSGGYWQVDYDDESCLAQIHPSPYASVVLTQGSVSITVEATQGFALRYVGGTWHMDTYGYVGTGDIVSVATPEGIFQGVMDPGSVISWDADAPPVPDPSYAISIEVTTVEEEIYEYCGIVIESEF